MVQTILTDLTASITEFKTNPMAAISEAYGQPLAVLNRNKPAFYCIPPEVYEQMMEILDDVALAEEVRQRLEDPDAEYVEVSWDELQATI